MEDNMSPRKSQNNMLLLLIFMILDRSGAYVGVNIDTEGSNFPSTERVLEILNTHNITHVRLINADHKMLYALGYTGIKVTVGIMNHEIQGIGKSSENAAGWIKQNVLAFLPATNITAIAVGNEVLTSTTRFDMYLVPAIRNLHNALVASRINNYVKISSPQAMDVIPKFFPPSTATFNSSLRGIMKQFLQFLKNTNSHFMLNVQPYYGYLKGDGIFPLNFCLSHPLSDTEQIVDANTVSHYSSMFDAMVAAAYYAMQAENFSTIPVLVTATGWPWAGGRDESDASVENAKEYNNNLIARVLNGQGGSSQLQVNVYIDELFDEDLLGPPSRTHWGLYFSNGTAVYQLNFFNQTRFNQSSEKGMFCIAKMNATVEALQHGLDWACGIGHANCSAIQEGQPCYKNAVRFLASYAYNDYYQRNRGKESACDFGGTAMLYSQNPSDGSCIFAGSSSLNTTTSIASSFSGPSVSPYSRAIMVQLLPYIYVVLLIFLSLF